MSHKPGKVYLVDDDADLRAATAQWLELSGYRVEVFCDAPSALAQLDSGLEGVVVSDVRMPKMDGMEFLTRINALDPDLPVVLITAHGDVQMAVEAMRQGAYDFLEKPFEPEQLLESIQRASEKRRLVMENRTLRRRLNGNRDIEQQLIGDCAAMQRLRSELLDVADTEAPVLILGETGTGKEVVAQCLHNYASRNSGKFVAVNCGAIPENMVESELFGHERGAFTGAERRRIGRFEYAAGGTLFLDEIGTMPLALQVKVLRSLQEREVVRIGSNEPQAIDIRLVSATNTDLLTECSAGRFREDLYYRINVVELRVPPLRERGGDILLLFDYFLAQAAACYKRPSIALQSIDTALLMAHAWPGNVRALKNIAERCILSSLPAEQRLTAMLGRCGQTASGPDSSSLQELMRHHEHCLLEQTLTRHRGDVQAVMTELNLPRRTLNEKMTRHNLERRDFTQAPTGKILP